MILVTKPFLPPVNEYHEVIEGIWQRQWLTNNGPLVNELELKLKEYLKLKHLLYVSNGTLALQIAIKALDLKGEIITTPFSYVATVSSIVWENCTPVFADIDEGSLTINPDEIEKKITEKTCAILATHVYGIPCNTERIEAIARNNNLYVIYDAAHAFGCVYKGRSLYSYGDISTASFHATKLYHTIEGGAVITQHPELLKKMAYMRNFGHNGYEDFFGLGINAKSCEFHAGMGIINLKYIQGIIQKRKEISERYKNKLRNLKIRYPVIPAELEYNYAYFPVIFETEEQLLKSVKRLELSKIYTRRYFYPSLNKLPYVHKECLPVSERISHRVLCLPLYDSLSHGEVDMVCRILLRIQNYDE
ncbi:MAG TPA: DegT/DnrJ/EryC1/StrS family aminotransferase [Chitinophagaceae bacterium]